jgi:GNAT superfamily N-acetyltransferase
MISIRPAVADDISTITAFDLIAQGDDARLEFIRRVVHSNEAYVATEGDEVIAYGVLNYTFYHLGCIDMLYVHSDHRRKGAGEALLRHMESLCRTPKLFTSTNLSNLPMQTLLAKMNYVLSGVIYNLDEKDPEIVYFKPIEAVPPVLAGGMDMT